jgi:hypothetical protein
MDLLKFFRKTILLAAHPAILANFASQAKNLHAVAAVVAVAVAVAVVVVVVVFVDVDVVIVVVVDEDDEDVVVIVVVFAVAVAVIVVVVDFVGVSSSPFVFFSIQMRNKVFFYVAGAFQENVNLPILLHTLQNGLLLYNGSILWSEYHCDRIG